jgi:hypothetical protein
MNLINKNWIVIWLGKKAKELDEYLDEVNYRIIDEEIERSIYLKKELSKCRSLDAIHIATALMSRENEALHQDVWKIKK